MPSTQHMANNPRTKNQQSNLVDPNMHCLFAHPIEHVYTFLLCSLSSMRACIKEAQGSSLQKKHSHDALYRFEPAQCLLQEDCVESFQIEMNLTSLKGREQSRYLSALDLRATAILKAREKVS